MPSGHKDSNPNAGEKSGGGLKNVDGREMGSAYNKQDKPKASFKETYSPNDDVRELPGKPGLETGAY